MPFGTDEELWKAMCAVRKDVLGTDGLYPLGGAGGIPMGWLAETTIKLRCRNDHVGSVHLAALRSVQAFDAWCPHGSCGARAFVTTPIDHDGPFRSWQALQLSEPEKYGEFEKEGHNG
jgi:hypothetical protein